jgi:hypothetical protein
LILQLLSIIGKECLIFELDEKAEEFFGNIYNKCNGEKQNIIGSDPYIR